MTCINQYPPILISLRFFGKLVTVSVCRRRLIIILGLNDDFSLEFRSDYILGSKHVLAWLTPIIRDWKILLSSDLHKYFCIRFLKLVAWAFFDTTVIIQLIIGLITFKSMTHPTYFTEKFYLKDVNGYHKLIYSVVVKSQTLIWRVHDG